VADIKFGTDGVRGLAYESLTLQHAFLIGRAAAQVFGTAHAVLGRDTRESGPAFTAALAAGLRAGGVTALDLGVAPTPAVAHVASLRAAIGVVISASHNPWHDNGIKLFAPTGSKLTDEEQAAVEAALAGFDETAVPSDLEGELESIQTETSAWVSAVASSIDVQLDGLTVVLDCAHGAASHVVAPALADLGAEVTVIANTPDGRNINDQCGSTHPELLAQTVQEQGAVVGLALDGDADRLLAVDENGNVVDGDQLMAMIALDMQQRGVLADNRLVVTVMSNLGLLRAMEGAGIEVAVTAVGDRNILIALDELAANFGGEQSGHLIFGDHAGTGDGFLSAVQLLSLLKRSAQPLSELANGSMTTFPQVLRNVAVDQKMPDIAEQIAAEIDGVEARLGSEGRVLVRASGTEPVVRVMVEAAEVSQAEVACNELCDAVAGLLG